MGRSSSHLWQTAFHKLFRRHSSQTKGKQRALPDDSENSEHPDGFCLYSQEMLEEENRRLKALGLRSSDSTDVSYASAMETIRSPAHVYTVSSSEWASFAAYEQLLDDPYDEAAAQRLHSVLSVYSKIYTIAKIVVWALMMYGVELDETSDDLLAHIRAAEAAVDTDSLPELIEITENLYYSLYARLIMEIANVELCSYFDLDLRRMVIKEVFTLPEPGHLIKILITFKDFLDAREVCVDLDRTLLKERQREIIRRATARMAITGFSTHDLVGYRTFTVRIVSDDTHPFCQKWRGLAYLYQMPGVETLTLFSEKYLTIMPKVMFTGGYPMTDLPFTNRNAIAPDVWERETILDNRTATLAKLESKTIGDIRRQDTRRRLIDYVKEHKCICRSSCKCSADCTMDVEQPCPCSERILCIALAQRRRGAGEQDFGPRCGSLARALFEGLAMVSRDVAHYELVAQLNHAMQLLEEEVGKQRHAAARANGLA
ncbi:uncharacterized protein ACLA_031740 [Aspergillus clavatus NRRL 1]|uniref:Uncharacterized protein n=1 Tax=Aspergillus clavatus (strain ATCC 1007 / CBS 513.65 / DSM 816 / NCTC 3887 / NRRL 1 / QM 1276 / 107) TaxID=344612 RepID=A1CS20_ASPCL|nr:uncharacterized protein ACLA_031740 [Aspergillus clavatus NRRL 1]EAW08441.1 conserved hypothetical protein [Aspergillus clavatus NRRL 1]